MVTAIRLGHRKESSDYEHNARTVGAGIDDRWIAAQLGVDANKIVRWRNRVVSESVSRIEKEHLRRTYHGGKDSNKQAELRSKVIEVTTQTTPNDVTHWSCRSMARHRRWRRSSKKSSRVGRRCMNHLNDYSVKDTTLELLGGFIDIRNPSDVSGVRPFVDR